MREEDRRPLSERLEDLRIEWEESPLDAAAGCFSCLVSGVSCAILLVGVVLLFARLCQ